MDDLDTIRDYEEHNFRVSREALGSTYDLYDGVLGLYKLLADLVRESKVPSRDDIAAGTAFLLGARYAFEKGVLELMRGHMTESFSYIRSAIEHAGFADLVRRSPQQAMTWLKSGDSPKAYKEYRDAFSTGRAFPKDDPLMKKLYDRYDFASKRVHASLYSYATRLKVMRDSQTSAVEMKYAYFDFDNKADLARMFLWIIDTHFGIIQVFSRVLQEAVDHDRRRWELHFNTVDTRVATHKEQWRPLIQV